MLSVLVVISAGVLIHFLICIKQLGAVNGIGAVRGRNIARRQIEDLAGASRVVSAECTRVSIPQQGIIGERGNRVAQVIDIGGIGGDISGVLLMLVVLAAISVVFWLMLSVLAVISAVFC